MKAVKVESDGYIKLPKEMRSKKGQAGFLDWRNKKKLKASRIKAKQTSSRRGGNRKMSIRKPMNGAAM